MVTINIRYQAVNIVDNYNGTYTFQFIKGWAFVCEVPNVSHCDTDQVVRDAALIGVNLINI